MTATLNSILADIQHCKVCTAYLPYPPRPVVRAGPEARARHHRPGARLEGT